MALDVTPLLGAPTGVAGFIREVCAHLPAPGYRVTGYALSARRRAGARRELPAGVQLARRPVPARAVRRSWLVRDWPSAELVAGAMDVVHGTNFVVPPTRRAAAVVTVHDLTFVHYPQYSQADTLQYSNLIRRAVRRGAVVQTHSRFVANEIEEWLHIAPEQVVVLPPGIPDLSGLRAAKPDRGVALAKARRYVLALGTEEPRKELPLLIRAFDQIAADHPDTFLVLAGPRGWGSRQVDDALEAAGHRNSVRRLGPLSGTDRNALLRGAAVLAFPTRYEGFGFPAVEALAVGVPVVASACGTLLEVLGDAARLTPEGDVMALAAALDSELRSGPDEAAARARQAWAARYSWDSLAAGLRALYSRLAPERARRR